MSRAAVAEHAIDLGQIRDELAQADREGDERRFVALAKQTLCGLPSREPTQLDFVVFERLLTMYEREGIYHDAIELCADAGVLCNHVQDDYGAAHFRLRGALLCVLALDFNTAQSVLEAELGVSIERPQRLSKIAAALRHLPSADDEEDNERLRNQARLALAQLWAARGHYAAAENLLTDLLKALQRVEDPALSSEDIWIFLAEIQLDSGDFRAFDTTLSDKPKTMPSAARWDLLQGMRYRWTGQYSEAIRRFRSVIEQTQDTPSAYILLEARWQLIDVLAVLNRLDESEAILDDIETSYPGRDRIGRMRRLLAARDLRGDGPGSAKGTLNPIPLADAPPDPEESVAPVLSPRRSTRLRVDTANVINELLLDLHGDRLDEAVLRLSVLEGLVGESDSVLLQARLAYSKMLIDYYCGEYERALRHGDAARLAFDRLGMRPDTWACMRLRTWVLRRMSAPPEQIEASRADEARVLDNMQSALTPDDRIFHNLNKWSRTDERLSSLMRELHQQWGEVPSSGFFARRRRFRLLRAAEAAISKCIGWDDTSPILASYEQTKTNGVYDDVRAKLGSRHSKARSKALPHPFWLPADVAVVRYIVLPDRIEGFAIWRYGTQLLDCAEPLPRARVRQRVARLIRYCEGPEPWNGQHSAVKNTSTMLAIDQLAAALPRRIRQLIILTDDALHQVPFSALTVDGQPLAARFAPMLMTSFAWAPHQRPPCAKGRVVTCIGVETSAHEPRLDRLEQVDAEFQAIANNVLDPPQACMGEAATHETVKDLLHHGELIHFACHGDFDIEHPHRSGPPPSPGLADHG